MSIKPITCLAAGLLVLGLAPIQDAQAAQVYRNMAQNGGNVCTGALPTFEGALRKRPKAIANEGSSAAFVTCSMPSDATGPRPLSVTPWFTNTTAASVSITCTLVEGSASDGSYFSTNTKVFTAGLSDGIPITMNPTGTTRAMSISCALPPGVALTTYNVSGYEEVGA